MKRLQKEVLETIATKNKKRSTVAQWICLRICRSSVETLVKTKHFSNCKLWGSSRTPWSCGLIPHVLDGEVEGSNLAAAESHRFNFFNAGSYQFSLVEMRWKAEEEERRWKVET